MDIDDGYILWTGIWKGMSLPSPRHPYSSRAPALGNSKGRSLRVMPIPPFSPFQPTSSR